MKFSLAIPTSDPAWIRLPLSVKERARVWILAFEAVTFEEGRVEKAIRRISHITNKTPGHVRYMYWRLKQGGDWRTFVDRRHLAKPTKAEGQA